ncbi:MAG: hypothetical protein VKO39_11825 [Cyanobacteriota bacterium]|nr:hypothetical protein [Cyanobacteriota bacterium]
MTKPLVDGLGLMAEREGLPRADVVRRALGLYARALQAEAQGQLIAFAKPQRPNGPEVVELIRLHATSPEAPSIDERLPEQGAQDEYQRFEMRMSQQLLDGLGAMADQEGLGRADVVRRALGLYARALQAEAQGQCIAFANLHPHNTVDVVQLIKLKQ